MNNASSSIGLLNTLRMEGCNLFWVTPLPAFVHALSYDLFLPSDQFAFNFFFFKGDNWCIRSMKLKKMLLVEKKSIDCDI